MAIRVWRRGEHYDVLVVVDTEHGQRYRSAEPLTALEVVTRLAQLGCHPADVGQAMSATDPGWMARLTAKPAMVEVELQLDLPRGGPSKLIRGVGDRPFSGRGSCVRNVQDTAGRRGLP